MAAACGWGIEPRKLMYPSTSGHVPTGVYMRYRQNELFLSRSSGGSSTFSWYTVGRKMSDKNLKQWKT
jgi:hypothetical protein